MAIEVCTETAEESYQQCSEYRDEGYNACSNWDDECCDWWPCSWGCPCQPDGTVSEADCSLSDPFLIGTLAAQLDPRGPEVVEKLHLMLGCLVTGDCLCAIDPDCLQLEIRNPHEEELHKVTIQMCIGAKCWTMPGMTDVWEHDETIRVPFRPVPEMEAFMRVSGERFRLQILSRGKPVLFGSPVEQKVTTPSLKGGDS